MSSDKPFFSVVIPTYNRSDFILATLKSVFDQSFENYEVIVVDNKSTDNTIELLKPYITSGQIRLITNDKNYERAKSRNVGMSVAKGEYLTFLDSDDFMYSNNLNDAYHYTKENRNLVFHNLYELVNRDLEVIYRYQFKPLDDAKARIAEGNFLSCIGVFVHKKVYRTIFWDESPIMTGSEDYDFWLRVIASYPNVGRISKINSGVLHHCSRTINHQEAESTRKRFQYMIEKYTNDAEFLQAYKSYFNEIQATLWMFQAGIEKETGNIRSSIHTLFLAVNLSASRVFKRQFYSLLLANLLLILTPWRRK